MSVLLVNGCSFTRGLGQTLAWPYSLKTDTRWSHVINLASNGAGNNYICRSTINYIETYRPDPKHTLVVVMWSGVGRIDVSVSAEWYQHIKSTFKVGKSDQINHWIHTGSSGNVNCLETICRVTDPTSLCVDSLQNFILLGGYLQAKGFNYLFTSYVNYWNDDGPYNQTTNNDYNIGYHCKDNPLYKNFDFSNWFFVNDQRDCFGEFASHDIATRDDSHPGPLMHQRFAQEIVLPQIQQIHMQGH